MPISFDTIPGPASLRKPGVYSEVDNSQAVRGPQGITYRRLIIGSKTAGGSAVAEKLVRVTSVAQADALFGPGSMLAGMVRAAMAQDTYTELHAMPLEDSAAGAAATATVTVGGTATAAGTLYLFVAGRRVDVGVGSGDAAAAVATKIAAAITSNANLPVTAAAAAEVVTLTAKNTGEAGNGLDVRANYFDGQALPAGLTVATTAFTGGTGNPDIANALAAIGQEWFQVWAVGYTDEANLSELENELASRFAWDREIEAHAFGAVRGTVGELASIGALHNSPHLGLPHASYEPMPNWEKAAETMAIAAKYAAIDPARPLQNINYAWCLPPQTGDKLTDAERNSLLFDGIATTKVVVADMVAERLITTYQQNAAGAEDFSYLDVETLFTVMYIRHDWADLVRRKYPRSKLADDGTRYGPGQQVVTPKTMAAEALNRFREWELLGLVENADQFKQDLISERNLSDPNRLDMLLPPDLVNALRVVAVKIQFRL
ncbi:phage tail sheath C-terminal domain-containing protein [Pseudomonas schmalbachii]|uniref:Phage tail protein n=1 Tax=Pseudomonas schmalbachii TaxID=2816993 RepID=A0ABS3TKF3_9PSED|nr:phage tail sheath C-terminal domain-containing protein [Pseudomonas schmalbachii]MBO3274130.1 phage tail protein [Pseudomonas schmalbachii]